MSKFALKDFQGVSPVLYAFWDKGHRLDDGLMHLQTDRCIAAGAHGVTVLGLVTEINRMDRDERLALVRTVGKAINGRVPYSVTIGEPSEQGQIEFARAAADAGADWVILQPPPVKGVSEESLIGFFKRVADQSPVPVAIQNNPVNLDVSLSNAALAALANGHERIMLIKGEGSALAVAELKSKVGPDVAIFAGHGGVEYPLNIAGGCAGLIPAPELLDWQVAVHNLLVSSNADENADGLRRHAELLPWIVMMTRSGVEGMLAYGKRLMAARLGLTEPVFRNPSITPTSLGLAEVGRMHERLGAL